VRSRPVIVEPEYRAGIEVVGILHPGEMGAAIAAGLVGATEVVWAGEGRSPATRARADAAGLRDVGSLAALTDSAAVVIAVCPPNAATHVAASVASLGFAGTYVDANAISPTTARAIDRSVTMGGATYVDGGIIGGPGAPRLFLSGRRADVLAASFGPPVKPIVLESGTHAASALKMMYAGWTKGTTALLFAITAGARGLGVEDALLAEWERSQPALPGRIQGSVGSTHKAWRWSGEMREIEQTLTDVGIPPGFHSSAAEVYDRLQSLKDDAEPTLDEVLDLLARPHVEQ
jgi:3-hydroxyisobutyrate dehydrogenase-like beta-hydroxyacid dehydrogenase